MFTDPVTLIDQTLSNLRDVAALLQDEFDPRIHSIPTEQGRICLEAHTRIVALVPSLRAARATQQPDLMSRQRHACIDCD